MLHHIARLTFAFIIGRLKPEGPRGVVDGVCALAAIEQVWIGAGWVVHELVNEALEGSSTALIVVENHIVLPPLVDPH